MSDLSIVGIAVAAVAAFLFGFIYYVFLGKQTAELSGAEAAADEQPPPWKLVVEITRAVVVSAVVAGVAAVAELESPGEGALLTLALWVGFPVVLFSGAIIWESFPPKLAAIHLGDWLGKLLLIGVIVGLFQ